MRLTHLALSWATLVFLLAGGVKGLTGMGLPTIAMGLLSLLLTPGEAAALLIIPSMVTNVWQFVRRPRRLQLLRRLWPMMAMIFLATGVAADLIVGHEAAHATAALGAALLAYAGVSLARVRLAVPRRHELWLSLVVGGATGLMTGATAVFVIPAVPYLQALDFDPDDLVQALGLSFTVSTLALAIALAAHGAFHLSAAGLSSLLTAPALAGMGIGQALRTRVQPATFRRLFLLGLLVLGADLILRSLI
jgi:uncharacterized protein